MVAQAVQAACITAGSGLALRMSYRVALAHMAARCSQAVEAAQASPGFSALSKM
jgi:hypothetical protein